MMVIVLRAPDSHTAAHLSGMAQGVGDVLAALDHLSTEMGDLNAAERQQIEAQLRRLVPVHKVTNWTSQKGGIEREMALIKVAGTGEKRVEALRMADAFRARPVDTTHTSFVFEITGAPSKIDSFIELMRPLGLVEVSRTGVAAISRGPEQM